jgi:solute carrier family 25 (mitochondrial phosphate transporter), member 3
MEEARIKMVGDESWAKENVVSSIARLVYEDGLLNSFTGLPAMLAKQVPYTMGKQVSFDVFSGMLYSLAAVYATGTGDLKWLISLSSAFLASVVACLLSQPGDMILTATYQRGGGAHRRTTSNSEHQKSDMQLKQGGTTSKSLVTIIRDIYRNHGLGGFYIGTQARLLHVVSIITFQLVMYDIIKMALGLPVTGAH